MDNRQERTVNALESVEIYLVQNPVRPEPPLLAGMRKSLRASVARIRTLEAEQSDAKYAISGHVNDRVSKLRRDRMMPLVRIAKPLLAFAPGVEAALRVPHARSDARTIAMAALKLADALAPHARLLSAAGLSKDYLRAFRQEARDLGLAAKNAESARARRGKATQALAAEFKKGMKTLTVIEGLVMLHHGSEKNAVKHWKSRRRVSKRMGRPRTRKKHDPQHMASGMELAAHT